MELTGRSARYVVGLFCTSALHREQCHGRFRCPLFRLWCWGRRYWSVSCLRMVRSGMINGTIMGDTVSGSVKVGNQTYDVTSTP